MGDKRISIHFEHGLGDAVHAAHVLALYVKRGYAVEVSTTPDKTRLFQAAGATIVPAGAAKHEWPHPPGSEPKFGEPWQGNKAAFNISLNPLPHIGTPAEVWQELCDLRLSLVPQTPSATVEFVKQFLAQLPRPIILIHTKANTGTEKKDIHHDTTKTLYDQLLERTAGSLVLLDWEELRPGQSPHGERRMPMRWCYRVRHMRDDWRALNLIELAELMRQADLLVGVDSGPLHFARFTDTPAVGLWRDHYPAHFALPRANTVHLVDQQHSHVDRYKRIDFRTILLQPAFGAGEMAHHILRMLEPPRYLSAEQKAADVQLQNFLDRTHGDGSNNGRFSNLVRCDRDVAFRLLFEHLAKDRATPPVMVETGCIRSHDDWGGAGFSTFLFGTFFGQCGGMLHSVDLSDENCRFARSLTAHCQSRVQIHTRHSHDFLKAWSGGPIDVFYSDSLDVDQPGYLESCLEECRLALPHLAPDARILIDDTVFHHDKWDGKGGKAVPWLLQNGWELQYAGYQALLRRKAPEATPMPAPLYATASKPPAYINNRDLLDWPRQMAVDLERLGCEPVLVDNASTYEPLLDWYRTCPYRVVHQKDANGKPWNSGFLGSWLSGLIERDGAEWYLVTDSDLDLSRIPDDMLERMRWAMVKWPELIKVGVSLEINDIPDSNPIRQRILSEQAGCWAKKLADGVFSAPTDVTLALYDRSRGVSVGRGDPAARLDRPYTARHMPWYLGKTDWPADFAHYVPRAQHHFTNYTEGLRFAS